MQFTIKQSTLLGMVQLAGKKDIRYYLNGVRIEFNYDKTRAIATDGCKIGVYLESDKQNTGVGALTIPREFIEKLPKLPKRQDRTLEFIHNDQLSNNSWIVKNGQDIYHFQAIGDQYPDIARVFHGIKTSGEPAQFNADYLISFNKCAQHLKGVSGNDNIFISHNGKNAALIDIVGLNEFIGAVMPYKISGDNSCSGAIANPDIYAPLIQNITVQNNAFIPESEKLAA